MTEIHPLKPCPFCGSTSLEFPPSLRVSQFVICDTCGTQGPFCKEIAGEDTYTISRKEAALMWNQRHD